MDGSLAVTGGFTGDYASVAVLTSTDPIHAFSQTGSMFDFVSNSPTNPATAALVQQSGGSPLFSESGWDSSTLDGSNFTGTFHIIVPYDANLGGYGWAVELSAEASTGFGSGISDFGRTASLQSVTLPDGTPVSGVTFDSGLQLTPASAPEPSAFTLLGIGCVGLLGYAGLRRKRASRAAAAV